MIKSVYALITDAQYGAFYGKCAKLNIDPGEQFKKLIVDFITEKPVMVKHAKGDGVKYGT